jgi:hypothetical protein
MAAPIDSFEIFINEQRADLAVFRITLTILFCAWWGKNPQRQEHVCKT